MTNHDFEAFVERWCQAHEICANKSAPSDSAINRVFDLLKDFTMEDVENAISQHSRTNRFAPTVADIVSIIEKLQPQYPSWEEAWASAPKEDGTGVESTVCMINAGYEAWCKVENDYQHDKFGARTVFKKIYEQLVEGYKLVGRKPFYRIYYGNDSKAYQAQVIRKAISEGKVTFAGFEAKLRELEPERFTSIAQLVHEKAKQGGHSEVAKFHIAKCYEILAQGEEREKQEKLDRQNAANAPQPKPYSKGNPLDAATTGKKKPIQNLDLTWTMPLEEEKAFFMATYGITIK